ncbi:hypothetical protein, partial [Kistimonas scapharcae]|uniref:hypothetical protein n=1 Tax=Kistimonas scapharcae TaxID=1036133 RepID=UPI0031E6BB1E
MIGYLSYPKSLGSNAASETYRVEVGASVRFKEELEDTRTGQVFHLKPCVLSKDIDVVLVGSRSDRFLNRVDAHLDRLDERNIKAIMVVPDSYDSRLNSFYRDPFNYQGLKYAFFNKAIFVSTQKLLCRPHGSQHEAYSIIFASLG